MLSSRYEYPRTGTWIAALGFGVLMITVCGLASRFASVTATLKPEGAETTGGDNAPPDMILNVAGTRAPFGAGGEVLAEPGAGAGVVLFGLLVLVLVLVDAVVVGLVEAAVVGTCEPVLVAVDLPPDAPHPVSRRTRKSPKTFGARRTQAA